MSCNTDSPIFVFEKLELAGKMDYLVKCLQHKHEDLSSVPEPM